MGLIACDGIDALYFVSYLRFILYPKIVKFWSIKINLKNIRVWLRLLYLAFFKIFICILFKKNENFKKQRTDWTAMGNRRYPSLD